MPEAPIYSATGEVTERFSAEQLAADLRARGTRRAAPSTASTPSSSSSPRAARPGDVVVTLSNGDFGGIWEKLLARLGAPAG